VRKISSQKTTGEKPLPVVPVMPVVPLTGRTSTVWLDVWEGAIVFVSHFRRSNKY
jgi:hypothetical protein